MLRPEFVFVADNGFHQVSRLLQINNHTLFQNAILMALKVDVVPNLKQEHTQHDALLLPCFLQYSPLATHLDLKSITLAYV